MTEYQKTFLLQQIQYKIPCANSANSANRKQYLFAFRINTSTEKHNTAQKRTNRVIQFDYTDCG